jgi:hypothetical protein
VSQSGGGRSPPQFVLIAHPRRSRDVWLVVQRGPGAAGRSVVGWVAHFPVGLIWARCGTATATAARSGRQHDGPEEAEGLGLEGDQVLLRQGHDGSCGHCVARACRLATRGCKRS